MSCELVFSLFYVLPLKFPCPSDGNLARANSACSSVHSLRVLTARLQRLPLIHLFHVIRTALCSRLKQHTPEWLPFQRHQAYVRLTSFKLSTDQHRLAYDQLTQLLREV